jgi:host factor-I protein
MNLQDAFLNQARLQKVPVTVYLSGGHPIKGLVTGFDQFSLLLSVEGKYNLVYKHAVSSIVPVRQINVFKHEGTEKPAVPDKDVTINE